VEEDDNATEARDVDCNAPVEVPKEVNQADCEEEEGEIEKDREQANDFWNIVPMETLVSLRNISHTTMSGSEHSRIDAFYKCLVNHLENR